MQVAQIVAGYSLGEADLLRRAMGKKKADEMEKQKSRFMQGGMEKGHPKEKLEKLFDLLAKFAEYGFNKSHSAAYGYLAYLTGYLKAHYPVEFMASLLTSETGNTDKVVKYINECRDLGIQVLAPDVNKSNMNFTPDSGAIRFGLGAVKNVGAGAVEAIVEARKEGGAFVSLDDFCERVDLSAVNRRVIESLIRAGAMDNLKGTRSQLFSIIEDCIESGQRSQKDKASGQGGLFGALFGGDEAAPPERMLPNVPDWTPADKLRGEKETIGFYVTGHPLEEFRWKITELGAHSSASISECEKGQEIAICGIMTGVQRRRNKEGKPWCFMQLEDMLGATEVLLFATRYEQLQNEVAEDRPVLIRGKAMPEEDGTVKVNIHDIIPLDKVRVDFPSIISVRVRLTEHTHNAADRAEELGRLFSRKPGQTDVRLRIDKYKDFSVTLDIPTKVRPDKEFHAEVERICGPQSVEVLAG